MGSPHDAFVKNEKILIPFMFTPLLFLTLIAIRKTSSISGQDQSRMVDLSFRNLEDVPSDILNQPNLEGLCLRGNSIKKLPDDILKLHNLKILDLEFNQIPDLPGKMESLEELYLQSNQLRVFPEKITESKNLKILNLSCNFFLTKLSESIRKLTNLRKLDLSLNDIKEIDDSILYLSNLEELNFYSNDISEIPAELLEKLKNLKILNLSHNKFSRFIEDVKTTAKLEKLYVANNELTAVPENIKFLNNLKELDLSHGKIQEISTFIGDLNYLEKLRLEHNDLSGLPSSIKKLTSLQELHLYSNQIKDLPEDVFDDLKNLTILDLSSNKLEELPENIGNLTTLKKLYLNNNRLKRIPDSIEKLTNIDEMTFNKNELMEHPDISSQSVEILNFSNNKITEIRNSVGKLTNLRILNFEDNQLEGVQEGVFENLKSLRELNLSRNRLKNIPITVEKLSSLKRLYLPENQLTEIPSEIGKIESLNGIDLSHNRLRSLPSSIRNLRSLGVLNLLGNPIVYSSSCKDRLGRVELIEIFDDRAIFDEIKFDDDIVDKDWCLQNYNSQPLHWNLETLKKLKITETVLKMSEAELKVTSNLRNNLIKFIKKFSKISTREECVEEDPSIYINKQDVKNINHFINMLNENQNDENVSILKNLFSYFLTHCMNGNNIIDHQKSGIIDQKGSIVDQNLQQCSHFFDYFRDVLNIIDDPSIFCSSSQINKFKDAFILMQNDICCLEDDLEEFLKRKLTILKEFSFRKLMRPASFNNPDILIHWENELKETLGFEFVFKKEFSEIKNDPFGGNIGNALKAFLDYFSPEKVIEMILESINLGETVKLYSPIEIENLLVKMNILVRNIESIKN